MVFYLDKQFYEMFGRQPLLFSAPGRVNLIGEHTDYNEGFVLPGAIDKCIYIAIRKTEKGTLNVYANQFKEKIEVKIDELKPSGNWFTYLAGMMFQLKKKSNSITGIDAIIDGNIPVGAGMSSSAAICSAFGFALNELFCLNIDKMELALMGQKTEHTFAGVKCGIMDQFASLHGKAGNVMKLDCRSLEFEYIPFDFPDYRIVLVNTMISHSLADSEYNVRRQQCEEGVGIMKKFLPEIKSLRDIQLDKLEEHENDMPEKIFQRCSYVIKENQRLLRGCEYLKKGNINEFGKLMYETHEGLSKDYGVSCAELDFLVKTSENIEGIAGARMMGGGFGGCTINLVKSGEVKNFTEKIKAAYQKEFKKDPEVYVTQIENGARGIPVNQ